MAFIEASVPADLKRHRAWLLWRFEQHTGEAKPRKVPYYANGVTRHGKQGAPEDIAHLTTFDAALLAYKEGGYAGLGFAPLPGTGITALDFDNCVAPGGGLPDEVAAIAAATYSEVSPSGRGVRAFVRGDFGNRKAATTDTDYGFETFSTSGFVTVTGDVLPLCDLMGNADKIADGGSEIEALCEKRFTRSASAADPNDFMAGLEPRLGLSPQDMMDLVYRLDADMGRDDWIRVGMALHHECDGDDTGFDIWNDWSALGEKYPGDEALRAQWESFERRKGERRHQVTMATVKYLVKQEEGPVTYEQMLEQAALVTPGSACATGDHFEGKFPVVRAASATRQKGTEWLVKGVLPQADFVVLYGASGSGKTFVALDIAAAIARGEPWREHRTKKGSVLLIAAEGTGGVGRRLAAYCKLHQIDADKLDIGVIMAAPNIMEAEDVGELVKSARAAMGDDLKLIIVDTYAQVTPGANENAADDMGRALSNIRVLGKATGATVLVVHHAGKDLHRGARGWSGIRAAADAEIEVVRHEQGGREIRITKMKDGEDGLAWGFKLEVVDLGFDTDGDPITSCVAIGSELPRPPVDDTENKRVKRRGKIETHVLEMVELVDPGAQTMSLAEFGILCGDALPAPEPGKRDTRRQLALRAILSIARDPEAPFGVKSGLVVFYQ